MSKSLDLFNSFDGLEWGTRTVDEKYWREAATNVNGSQCLVRRLWQARLYEVGKTTGMTGCAKVVHVRVWVWSADRFRLMLISLLPDIASSVWLGGIADSLPDITRCIAAPTIQSQWMFAIVSTRHSS